MLICILMGISVGADYLAEPGYAGGIAGVIFDIKAYGIILRAFFCSKILLAISSVMPMRMDI